MSLKLLIINGTSRSPQATGPASAGAGWGVSAWFEKRLQSALSAKSLQASVTNVEPVSHFKLPIEIGTVPAAMKYVGADYTDQGVKAWSKLVKEADGVFIVTPQYNNMPTPTLALAIDHLAPEWENKLIGILGYGPGGGLNSAKILKENTGPVLKMNIVEPIGSVKYTQEDGAYNKLTIEGTEDVIGSQHEEADKVIKVVLDNLSK